MLHEKFQTISIPHTAKYSFMQGEFVGVGRSSANAAMKVRRMRETGHIGKRGESISPFPEPRH